MATFMYKAITNKGVVVKNKVEAENKVSLINSLKNNNLMPISIEQVNYKSKNNQKKQKKNITNIQEIIQKVNTTQVNRKENKVLTSREKINLYFTKAQKITTRDIMIFTQNFYLLKKANFNNIYALNTIIESTENLSFKAILEDILAGVEAGDNLYTTMEYYDNIFPYIYVNIIKVGELSGALTNSLEQAVKYLDETSALNRKLKGIFIPNIIQFILLIVLLFVGTLFAIPAIQGVFEELGTKDTLPAITLWFKDFVELLIKYWYIPTILLFIVIASILYYIKTPRGKYNYDYFKYKMPIFGKLIFALDFSRLMKAILINLKNGARIQEAIEVSKNVIQNYVMLSILENSINNILVGKSWIEPFEESGLTTPMMTEMLEIGMQTDLTEMMEKLIDYMDIDIDNIMNKIMKVLPQVVYAIVGVVLIFFVIVILVPCVQVYMGNFLFSAYEM